MYLQIYRFIISHLLCIKKIQNKLIINPNKIFLKTFAFFSNISEKGF